MHPDLFSIPAVRLFGLTIGPLTLHTYGVLMAVAFLVGLWIASRQAARAGLDRNRLVDLGIYTLIAGLVGAKLMLLAVDWSYYSRHPRELLSLLQSAGVFYGGFAAAIPVALLAARRYGLAIWPTLDALAPGVAIAQAIGRLGCLAAGCCYGKPSTLPWAVTFRSAWSGRILGTPLDEPLHPTQIYESLAALGIFFLLLWLAPRKRFHGQIAAIYVLAYAVGRFTIEFWRGDVARGFVLGGSLSTSQAIAILVAVGVLALLPYLIKKQRVAA
jgi:phosphatidylglycerol:prolipoprotein diacylglycerol transferase